MEDGGEHRHRYLSRRVFLRSAGVAVLVGSGASLLAACGDSSPVGPEAAAPTGGRSITLHRQEGCSCCATYADYLRKNAFVVDMKTVDDLGPIRRQYGIPDGAVGCHTSVLDRYVIEGHVPVAAIERLLSQRPALDGISVVGMPTNAPGMGEPNGQPLNVLSFRGAQVADYMSVTTF